MITLDTNVFVYLVDDSDPQKQAVARQVVAAAAKRRTILGLQVVGEFQAVAIRKLKLPAFIAAQNARNILTNFETVGPIPEDAELALGQLASGRLSYWDALLLACVQAAGCTAMLTEDMQDGATILGVEIVNPFGPDGLSKRAEELLTAD